MLKHGGETQIRVSGVCGGLGGVWSRGGSAVAIGGGSPVAWGGSDPPHLPSGARHTAAALVERLVVGPDVVPHVAQPEEVLAAQLQGATESGEEPLRRGLCETSMSGLARYVAL